MVEDILTQEEIDLLIKAVTQPHLEIDIEEEEKRQEESRYDFSRPNRFSKEHIRALHRVHEQFCRTYSGYMAAKLRNRVDVKVQSIEQILFGDFVRSLPNPSVLSIYKVHPLEGYAIVQFSPDIAFLLHDRLCGGDGVPMRRSRSLTDIEVAVLKRQVLSVFSSLLSDAWRDVAELSFELDYMESNPQFLQVAVDRDAVALITMRFELNEISDMISICLPHRTLEPILKNLTHIRMFESLQQPDPARIQLLKEQVRAAIVPMEVELGRTMVSVGDLLDLSTGDVVVLERKKHEALDVKIGSMTKFKGTPGRLGQRLGVVITNVLEPADEGGQDDE